MAEMIEDTYPMSPPATPRSTHLRVVPCGCEGTLTADLAAIAVQAVNAGRKVLAVCVDESPFKLVQCTGLGWRDPNFTAVPARSTLELVAAWFTATADASSPLLIVDQVVHLPVTGTGRQNDAELAAVLVALTNGDSERLFELTGLDREMYLRSADLAPLPPATLVVGSQLRRSASTDSPRLANVMGGVPLISLMTTVALFTRSEVDPDDRTKVTTTASWLKHRTLAEIPPPVTLHRPLAAGDGIPQGPWRAATN